MSFPSQVGKQNEIIAKATKRLVSVEDFQPRTLENVFELFNSFTEQKLLNQI